MPDIFRHSLLRTGIELMFLNQYQHTFDDKGRLTIPAKFRELPEEGAYVVQGLDHNLMVLPPEAFKKLYERLMGMSLTDPDARLLRHIILGNALQVIPDGAGRVLLSANLREYACLGEQVVFVGQGDYFEIWATEKWQEQQAQINNTELNEQRFAALDLTTR